MPVAAGWVAARVGAAAAARVLKAQRLIDRFSTVEGGDV
jgi:hypothetical protein